MGQSLFEIQTDRVQLTWGQSKATVPHAKLPDVAHTPYGLDILSATPPHRLTFARDTSSAPDRLFEQTDYTVLLKSIDGDRVQLRHMDPSLSEALHYDTSHTIGHGVLNFGSQIGRSRFVIEIAGQPHLTFEVEVFPSKIDYQTDYVALRDDLEMLQRGLIASYLRATYQQSHSVSEELASTSSWLAILASVMDDLTTAVAFVREHPYRHTKHWPTRLKASKITRVTPATRNALRIENAGSVSSFSDAADIYLPTAKARYTLDTPEHRWLAFHLQHAVRAIQRIIDRLPHRTTPRQRVIREHLDAWRHELRMLLRKPPFQALAHQTKRPLPSLTLQRAPGYREAYQACLALRNGLSLASGSILLSIKDLYLLYEYWCFITLLRLLADLSGDETPLARLLITHQNGLDLHLRKGQRQTFTFRGQEEKHVVCTYNPRYSGRGYLVPQQPDFALTVLSPSHPARRYILDAKYRLNQSPGYIRRFGIPGPPVDALNALHRYRDAILDEESDGGPNKRTVLQAIALFPYREPDPGVFAQSQLNNALKDVGVGAIPLLPNATEHLKTWLEALLNA